MHACLKEVFKEDEKCHNLMIFDNDQFFHIFQWKIIIKALCCGSESASQIIYDEVKADVERDATAHPSDQEIGLTAHKLMYPPGKIILVVRNHPSRNK